MANRRHGSTRPRRAGERASRCTRGRRGVGYWRRLGEEARGSRRRAAPLLVAAAVAASCSPAPRAAGPARARPRALVRGARSAGRDRAWVLGQTGKHVRINDVVRRTLPAVAAQPPPLTRSTSPGRARLTSRAGSPPSEQDRPGVEFVVKVRHGGREDTVWTQLLDPVSAAGPPPVGAGGRGPRALRRPGARARSWRRAASSRTPTTRGGPSGARPRSPCRDGDAPLVVVYLVDTLRADHTTPYGYARDTTPELAAFAKDAVVFEQAIAQASWTKPVGGVALHLAAAGAPPRRPAPRHPRPRARHAGGDAAGQGLRHRRRHRQLGDLPARTRTSSRASTSSPACTAPATGPRKAVEADGGGGRRARLPRRAPRASRASSTCTPWTRTCPTRRRRPSTGSSSRRPRPGARPPIPAATTRSRWTASGIIAQYDGDDRVRRPGVRPLRARAEGAAASTTARSSCSWPTTARSSWTTASGSTARRVFDELIRVPAHREVPAAARARAARVAQQVQAVDVLPTVLEALGLPVPAPPVIAGRPLQAVVAGRRARAARGLRDQPPRLRGPRHADQQGQVRPALQPRGGRAVLRPRGRPEGEDEPPRTRPASACAPEGRARGGDGAEPVPPHAALRGRGRVRDPAAAPAAGSRRVETAGFGPEDATRSRATAASSLLHRAAAAGPAARGRVRASVPWARRCGSRARATAARSAAADVLIAQEGVHPPAVPFKLPEIESEKERGRRTSSRASRGPPRRARVAGHDRGQEAAGGDGPRDLRAAEGARLHRRRLSFALTDADNGDEGGRRRASATAPGGRSERERTSNADR